MQEEIPQEIKQNRQTQFKIHPLILSRWSPRAMSGEPVTEQELMTLFEAAHWAPSSYNAQPWRFIYAFQKTPEWDTLFSLMVPANQEWTSKAGALIVIISHKLFEHNQKPSITHSFDAGAAWAMLALQGSAMGLVVHGMQGFDYKKAQDVCKIPEDYQVECMVAVGKQGKKEELNEKLREKEIPSSRKKLSEVVMKGTFM